MGKCSRVETGKRELYILNALMDIGVKSISASSFDTTLVGLPLVLYQWCQ